MLITYAMSFPTSNNGKSTPKTKLMKDFIKILKLAIIMIPNNFLVIYFMSETLSVFFYSA